MASSSSQNSQIKYVVFVCLLLISNLKGVGVKTMSDNGSTSSCPAESFTCPAETFTCPVESLTCPAESSTFPAPQKEPDIFISFWGTKIYQGFVGHLIKALSRKQIVAFVREKFERDDELPPAVVGAIERSLISLIIFSQDYASSRSCLEELVKILVCKEKNGQRQIVIPVFYKVNAADVRHQKGTYGNAFTEHERNYSQSRVQLWRSALSKSADFSGFSSSKYPNDVELLEQIVTCVLMFLNNMHQVQSKGLTGISKPIAHLESLLRQESKDVRVIGIWGMGGIGKTTIAEEVFNKLSSEYEGGCLLANVREESGRHGIISLKKELFSTLLKEDLKIDTPNGLPAYVKKRLSRMKVLVVLDDVNDSDQLEILVGACNWFGLGSRIIITTRDKQVLAKVVDDTYEVGELDFVESLRLFIVNAFKPNHLEMEYYELSKRVVNYAKGVPLVLKVLGHLLHGKEKEIWERQLEMLKKMPYEMVYDAMRLSYNDLDHDEQKIFLDIACFFDGLNLKVKYIKSLLKDRDYSVAAGLGRLEDLALITISHDNIVSMHDIIQEMAWKIVREESIEGPNNHRRLWDPDDIYQVLKSNEGSEAIRSIAINLSVIKELQLSPQVFAKMSKLQFLDLYSKEYQEGLYLRQGLESLPNEVRYLRWMHYPLKSLPTNFSMEKLVVLNLLFSQVENLWHGVQNPGNLEVVILCYSTRLMELPDFSKATNLKVMDLRLCIRLNHVHPSIFSLDKLEKLDLGGCISLTSLRSNVHLSSLRYLSLSGCKALKEFSVTSKNMKKLNLELTAIKQLPPSIGNQSKLEKLRLAYTYIENLPVSIKHLTRLRHLDVGYCKELQTLPELPPSLEKLDARGCISLKNVLFPSTVAEQLKENRKMVVFWNCLNLDEYSLWAIGLNARINIMKSAYQHLSTLGGDYDAQTTYVYPGSRVPEWLVYRTTHDYVTIDLSSAAPPHSPLLGFIFCFIVPQVTSDGLILRFSISEDDRGEGNSINVYLNRPRHEITSDHVCLMYNQQWSRYLYSRAKDHPRFKIKVTAVSRTLSSEYEPLLLRGFGVSPINTLKYQSFVQQMELGDNTRNALYGPDCYGRQQCGKNTLYGPDCYGRQQCGIFRNGRKPDGAMRCGGRRLTAPELLMSTTAGRQKMQALLKMIEYKGSVGAFLCWPSNPRVHLREFYPNLSE